MDFSYICWNQLAMTKKSILFVLISFLTVTSHSQQTINASITHGGLQRDYILYVPAIYDGNTAVPLLFNFHGYTSNAGQQIFYGEFRGIADTANFIMVLPEGTEDNNGSTHFNVGWGVSSVDDVGFTSALIDTLASQYTIDLDRVYSTGMSNGGFMSFHLACNLSNRIAAIASVTGSIVPATLSSCNPSHPIPVLQIHGDSDGTVPYAGGFGWSSPVSSLVSSWANQNNCPSTPIFTAMPDINTSDGSTVEKYEYEEGDACSQVIHYKILGGDHTWPGSAISFPGTNYDIKASKEAWNFLSQYDINGKIGCPTSSIEVIPAQEKELVKIVDFLGREVQPSEGSPLIYIYSDGTTERKIFVND